MQFKYTLPKPLIEKVLSFEEFANGGMQVSIRTKNGDIFKKILISNCMHIVAMRGYSELPFRVEDILEIFQTEDDKNPKERGGWIYWDNWK